MLDEAHHGANNDWDEYAMDQSVCFIHMEAAVLNVEIPEGEPVFFILEHVGLGNDYHGTVMLVMALNSCRMNFCFLNLRHYYF